jgi:hypothetical protein
MTKELQIKLKDCEQKQEAEIAKNKQLRQFLMEIDNYIKHYYDSSALIKNLKEIRSAQNKDKSRMQFKLLVRAVREERKNEKTKMGRSVLDN